MEQAKLPISLNNAIAYSYVLGWYAGRDGAPTDDGKISATEKIKEMHPDIVLACNAHNDLTKQRDDLLAACEAWMKVESESKTSNPCPDYNLRGIYRVKAVKLSKAAIASAS